jgi:hypothetical protein
MLITMTGVLDQLALGELKAFGLALPRLLKRALSLVDRRLVAGTRPPADLGGLRGRGILLLAL